MRARDTGFVVELRRGRADDALTIARLFRDTVHAVNRQDYSEAHLDAWAPYQVDLEHWRVVIESSYFMVAVSGGMVVGFGTVERQFDILRHSCEIGMLALALTPVILTGGIDLSVGSLLGLCAVGFGWLWHDAGWSVPAAAAGTLVLGAFGGGLNAGLIAGLRLPALIVTLGTYSLFRGLAEAFTHGAVSYTGFPAGFLRLGQGH